MTWPLKNPCQACKNDKHACYEWGTPQFCISFQEYRQQRMEAIVDPCVNCHQSESLDGSIQICEASKMCVKYNDYKAQRIGGKDMKWRPENWGNPYKADPDQKGFNRVKSVAYTAWDEGADAMLKTLIVWLKEPCDKHPGLREYPEHRFLCPDCMKELEG